MDAATILLDTSILIDFFRKRDKSKSILFQLAGQYRFSISVITAFEIKIGIKHFERIPNLTLVNLPENE